jgi:DNA mismatch repair protein MutL
MDDIIHLLPDSVANQIAAGEVVQRPASIVKELVENSIDAGAENIQVVVVDGGKTSVQVIDDGKGMSDTDARLSFERHATSKIFKATDMFGLTTMGFRGEALASIAAVAQVELKTRRPVDDLGSFIRISGSKIELQEPVACPSGCNFAVKNLFYNVPARRKFLKTNQTELSNVIADFERIVLVYPNIHFSLHNNGSEIFDLPKTTMKQRILDVFGKKINSELLPIEAETSLVSVSGYVAKPECSRKKGAKQYFFVNGRYMRHPYFHSAVMRAYENLIPSGEHVSYFVYLKVDASSIDVNVHPTKTEIKFDEEQSIWQVLSAVVKEALGKFTDVPSIEFDVVDKPEIPVMGFGKYVSAPPQFKSDYNPFKTKMPSGMGTTGWEELYKDLTSVDSGKTEANPIPISMGGNRIDECPDKSFIVEYGEGDGYGNDNMKGSADIWSKPSSSNQTLVADDILSFFQLKGRYIVLPVKSGVMLIDQHRAHVRILYERYMSSMVEQKGVSQRILFPEIVQFSKSEALAMDEIYSELQFVGFELSNLGGGSYSILGVPAGADDVDPVMLLRNLVISSLEKNGDVKIDARESIVLSLAYSAAIPYGQVLQDKEIEQLIGDLFATASPMITPDGKTVATIIEQNAIDKLF